MALPRRLEGLLEPAAYPHPVHTVELIETHISWVLLAGEFAYKIKRPVRYPFVDLRSAKRRAFLCHEEVRLNRRFAPELYLNVCRVTAHAGVLRLDGSGKTVEHAVKMRRFDRREELDRLLASARITPEELDLFGRTLADIHSGLPCLEATQSATSPAATRTLMLRNLDECTRAAAVLGEQVANATGELRASFEARLAAAAAWMSERVAHGRVRECHGDLHSQNVVRQGSRLLAFDCLEFDSQLRWIDIADEIAFLLADLEARNQPNHAHAFLQGYLRRSGDFDACRYLALYMAHRSFIRAKVVALTAASHHDRQGADDGAARAQYSAYLECARRSLGPKRPVLILMSGLSGSGKTWTADRIAPALGAIHLRSDVERKRLAGLAELEHSASSVGQGLYAPGASEQVYRHLEQAARSTLQGGYTTIVDATFTRREERSRFRDVAGELGLPVCVIHCQAPREVLESRLLERARRRNDASEADTSVLRWQEERDEPVRDDESLTVIEAMTTDHDAGERLVRRVSDWRQRSWPAQ